MDQRIKKINNIARGFSLIELIIVVAIMLVVTSAVLFRQSKFSSDILITNMAYEVALSIKDASVSGLSSRASSTIMSTDEPGVVSRIGYGIHIEPNPDGGGSPNSFINFVDVSGVSINTVVDDDSNIFNYFYTSTNDAVDKTTEMTQGQHIGKYCARINSGTPWNCFPDNPNQELNIVFVRPNPEAHITMGTHNSGDGNVYSEAKIIVESGLGDKCRTVSVSASGQISVDPLDPADPSGCSGGIE
ncbi:MAG: type II secretion system protein [Patescibacteria group bacterium]